MFTDNILLAGQIAGSITAVCVVFAGLIKYAFMKPIKRYIDIATAQIQPNANGGKSLPDAITILERLEFRQLNTNDRVQRVEDMLSQHLEMHTTRKKVKS
jgi:hypothetical protein